MALIHGGRLLAVDAPAAIIATFDRPLIGVRAAARYRLLQTLRTFPTHRTVQPFGETLHYTDRRDDVDSARLQQELAGFLHQHQFDDVWVGPVTPTVEDVFMERMGKAQGATP